MAEAKEPIQPPAKVAKVENPPLDAIKGDQYETHDDIAFNRAKEKTFAWLDSTKVDAKARIQIEALWNPASGTPVIDRVGETLGLADPRIEKLLSAVKDRNVSVPLEVPEILKDQNQPEFLRANLGLYFAKQLSGRRAHEEALQVLKMFPAERTVDPFTHYFYSAYSNMETMQKDAALKNIDNLLDSFTQPPRRYMVLAHMMKADMENWKDGENLEYVGRLMNDSARRLDLARGGKKTQAEQQEIVDILDRMIKKQEDKNNQQNQQANGSNPSDPSNPNGSNRSQQPGERPMGGSGQGKVDDKVLRQYAESWGTMPPAQRAKVIQEITRDLPAKYRPLIEEYFKALSRHRDPPRK
jgi:hypothetical protein